MLKKAPFLPILIFVLCIGLFIDQPVEASSLIKGTFVDVTYENVRIDEETTEKRLKSITIENNNGRTITLNIDKYASLSVNSIPVTIDAFKNGMQIEADVQLRRVKALRGTSGASQGSIDTNSKVVIGTINRLDQNRRFLSIRLDNGQTKTYYLNEETSIYQETQLVDYSVLYEGDRVKLTFSQYNTNLISTVEVNVQGVQIEGLYKGKIQQIQPIGNRITITDVAMFHNWMWEQNTSKNRTYTYSSKTPIYIGNQQVPLDQLRYYRNHNVYFVTINQFGKQIIEKMVIQQSSERSFYEPMASVNLNRDWIRLSSTGNIPYHDGTILIRNGRLVDENSLQYSGTAFVVTDGDRQHQFANVVHLTNDGFQSPNLTNHSIYFGRIQQTGPYTVTLNQTQLLSNNIWSSVVNPTFSFTNETIAVRDSNRSILTILPRDEMVDYVGQYGYFYVTNNHVVAIHLLDSRSSSISRLVSVGRMDGLLSSSPNTIRVRNVSQWQNGRWENTGEIASMDIEQATIIRDGKVIAAKDLALGDRLYIVHESKVKGRLIFVD